MATRSALVGREAERERLDEALERARLGSGSLVLLAGEAGVGKTRLAEELAEASGATVLRGRASAGARGALRADRRGAARVPARRPGRPRRLRPACGPTWR